MVAYVAPFLLYVIPTMIETKGWLGIPYEAICTLKGVLSAGAMWMLRSHYPKFSTKGFGIAVVAGFVGLIAWVLLDKLQNEVAIIRQLTGWLFDGSRAGFDPFADGGLTAARAAFVAVRLIELTLIVPLMEEFFWRGFLSRYLIADDFQNVPHGRFTPISMLIVTLAFASAHPELLAAIVWGLMINRLYQKTENLWACIVMHAITNGLLGAYILLTQSWNLW